MIHHLFKWLSDAFKFPSKSSFRLQKKKKRFSQHIHLTLHSLQETSNEEMHSRNISLLFKVKYQLSSNRVEFRMIEYWLIRNIDYLKTGNLYFQTSTIERRTWLGQMSMATLAQKPCGKSITVWITSNLHVMTKSGLQIALCNPCVRALDVWLSSLY